MMYEMKIPSLCIGSLLPSNGVSLLDWLLYYSAQKLNGDKKLVITKENKVKFFKGKKNIC